MSASIVAACILISYPISNAPWGDDFSYIRTALEFVRTGHVVYNGWAAPLGGWQILWGALVIKIFGFSFAVMQLSMIPISIITIYLFHRTLQQFGMTPNEALLGSLTLGLTPLFLEMSSIFLTDIPGVFAIILCVWMCQNAAAAEDDRDACKWIVLAGLTNIVAGSVRQTSWLGALVMVPATAWMLRRRRGIIPAAAIVWLLSLISIVACLHWFNRQPYTVPEAFELPKTLRSFNLLAHNWVRATLYLLLLVFPLAAAWLPVAGRLDKRARIIAATLLLLVIADIPHLAHRGELEYWMVPWLKPFLDMHLVPTSIKWILSGVIALTGILIAAQLTSSWLRPAGRSIPREKRVSEIFWILGPFSLSYVAVLIPRGSMAAAFIQDRYVLVLAPAFITFLLFAHRRWVAPSIPPVSVAAIVVFGALAVGWNHDFFANSRATSATLNQLLANGESATSIQAGLGIDGWTQTQYHGYMNEKKIRNPPGAYDPTPQTWELNEKCNYVWLFSQPLFSFTNVIRPKYFISEFPREDCPGSTIKPGASYRAWIPPFDREIKIQTLPLRDRSTNRPIEP